MSGETAVDSSEKCAAGVSWVAFAWHGETERLWTDGRN
jgi:hypothetical protein